MKRDLIITFITEIFVLIAGLLTYKFASEFFGEVSFSKYALIKRNVSYLSSALFLGMPVAIPRYVALKSKQKPLSDSYFLSGILLLYFVLLFFVILLFVFDKQVSFLLFGKVEYADLITPMILFLSGLIIHSSVYSYFRGNMLMVKANLLQFIDLALIPVFSFFMFDNIISVISLTGLLIMSVSSIVLVVLMLNMKERKISFEKSKTIFLYGIQRVPGDFGLSSLLSLPAIFAAHLSTTVEAGYVAFAISLLRMTGAFFAPLGLVLLPATAKIVSEKNYAQIKKYVRFLLITSLTLTFFGVLLYEIAGGFILSIYLGEYSGELLTITKVVIFGAFGYDIFVSLRSIIDGYYFKAENTINIIIVLALFLLMSVLIFILQLSNIYILYSFVLSVIILGILTVIKGFSIGKD